MSWKVKYGSREITESDDESRLYCSSHLPKPYEIWNYKATKKKKKGIPRQATSIWEQGSLAISIEQSQKRTEKVSVRQSAHLNLICQTRAPLSPVPINSSAPSNRHAESPSSATADGS